MQEYLAPDGDGNEAAERGREIWSRIEEKNWSMKQRLLPYARLVVLLPAKEFVDAVAGLHSQYFSTNRGRGPLADGQIHHHLALVIRADVSEAMYLEDREL